MAHRITKILVPVIDSVHAGPYLQLGAALLPPQGKIAALKVVTLPEESSLSEGAEHAPDSRAALEPIRTLLGDGKVEVRTLIRVAHRLSEGIAETAESESADLLILPWKGSATTEDRLFGRTIDRLLERPPCNTLVARTGDFTHCKQILFPVRGGPYAEFALEIASQLAVALNAEITVLHCAQRTPSLEFDEKFYRAFVRKLRFHHKVKRLMRVRGNPQDVILQEAQRHDLVITGAAARTEAQSFFLGPIVEHVAGGMDKPLLVVKTPEPFGSWSQESISAKPKVLSQRVDQWFAENTFHRGEFADLAKLLDLKKRQGVTISLGLPALNEAESIGNIIQTVKKALFDEIPLLDEIVVIDSESTDDTATIARDLGVPVFVHQEILPQHGSHRGKGEALWKSLYVLSGDIIVWVDTDIKNFYPGFVYGLLGPLLREPEIQYVKGFYRRPIKMEGRLVSEGGGRVTELTIRPLFNLFYPELSGMIQPLAGEYAGRRSVLEQVPFFTGYGVETGLLIDLFTEFGLNAIAQVDLEERVHRNQPLASLSQMSFAIIQVVMQRLQLKNRIEIMDEVNRSMKLIKPQGKSYALELKDIQDQERAPMLTIPEYRARRHAVGYS
ncbi:MAG TPA: glucosyl-3-phosphoglycerate synthase [Candidatus Binatia bacterium]|jgi:glucosyl-3-phosphoglycerate synthase